MKRIHPLGWLMFVAFVAGGVYFTVTIPEIWIGQIWIASAFVMIIGLWLLTRPAAKVEKLRAHGIRGQATILSATQTGTQINRQPVVRLTLAISAPGVTPFEAEKREIVPLIALGRLSSGALVTVYVDKDDHSRFALDWSDAPAVSAGPAVGGDDPRARMEKLGELKASGLISDDEYDEQKARILREI